MQIAFPPEEIIDGTLSDIIAENKLKQVKITEAEKAVHVGFSLMERKMNRSHKKRELSFQREKMSFFLTKRRKCLLKNNKRSLGENK